MPEDPLGVTIGAREIYDAVLGVREDVRGLKQDNESVNDKLADHESRIRSVERWKYALPLSVLGSAVAIYSGLK